MRRLLLCVLVLHAGWAWALPANSIPSEVDGAPQVQVGGEGIATLETGKTASSPNGKGRVNFSDSALRIGAAEALFDDGAIGSFEMGWLTLDDAAAKNGASTYLHRALVGYQSDGFEAQLGRGDNPQAHLVDFPTLRGDDLVTLIAPVNPFLNGVNPEESLYSDLASVTWNQKLQYEENLHVQHLPNSAGLEAGEGLNAFGVGFRYRGEVGLEAFERVPFWGISYERLLVDKESANGLNQVAAGAVFNLGAGVVHRLDLSVQDIYAWGSQLDSFRNWGETLEADANALTASLGLKHRPFGGRACEFGLTGAFKNYARVRDESSWGAALTAAREMGKGFHLVAQYSAQGRSSRLAALQSGGIELEQKIEAGLEFSFDAVFNEHLSPRRSLLNQRHGFLSK